MILNEKKLILLTESFINLKKNQKISYVFLKSLSILKFITLNYTFVFHDLSKVLAKSHVRFGVLKYNTFCLHIHI